MAQYDPFSALRFQGGPPASSTRWFDFDAWQWVDRPVARPVAPPVVIAPVEQVPQTPPTFRDRPADMRLHVSSTSYALPVPWSLAGIHEYAGLTPFSEMAEF